MHKNLHEVADAMRDFVGKPRTQLALENSDAWTVVCSSLDVLEDAQLAIEAYSAGDFPKKAGEQYLRIYGLLQALYLQQDALSELAKAASVVLDPSNELKAIRETRNAATGHPTKRRDGSSYFISRPTITKSEFLLMGRTKDGLPMFKPADVSAMIATQGKLIPQRLGVVLKSLKERDEAHRRRFKAMRVADSFPRTFSYHLSKVAEFIHDEKLHKAGIGHLEIIVKAYQTFREALKQRGEPVDGIDEMFAQTGHAISRLKKFFTEGEKPGFSVEDAEIYAFYLHQRHKVYADIAAETDSDYAS